MLNFSGRKIYLVLKKSNVLFDVKANIGQLLTSVGKGCPRGYATCKDKDCCEKPDQAEDKKVELWPKPADRSPTAWYGVCPKEPQPVNYDPYRIKVPNVAVPPLPPANVKPMLDCTKPMSPCSGKLLPDPPPCPPPPPPPFPWIYVWAVLGFFGSFGLVYRVYLFFEEPPKDESARIWKTRKVVRRPEYEHDLPPCVQYLIVGTGAAGWAAYQAIQKYDKTAKVLFVTREDIIPYMRPPMSKHMWWNPDPPDMESLGYVENGKFETMFLTQCKAFKDPVKFYRMKQGPAVSLASGWCVTRVDADHHVAYVQGNCEERPIYYERCLLAVGANPKNFRFFENAPKVVRDRVFLLRTIRDLENAFPKVKSAKHVTVIGGGFLGSELAWHLGKMNTVVERPEEQPPIEFTHIIKDKGILGGLIPEYLGEWAVEKIKEAGVTVIPKAQVYDAYTADDGKLELTLSNGTSLKTDYVFVCVGTEPDTAVALRSELETDKVNGGFLVNTELKARTHLYVAGDAASFYSTLKNTRLRCEHYGNASAQGAIAGANMTGQWLEANMEQKFRLQLGDVLEIEGIGEVGACLPTIALFKQCTEDDPPPKNALPVKNKPSPKKPEKDTGSGDKPCYKKTSEYRNRYKRGVLFYIRDQIVVGVVFVNIPPIEDRVEVVTEMLRARRSYKEINRMAEQLGFASTQCIYIEPEDEEQKAPCIQQFYKTY